MLEDFNLFFIHAIHMICYDSQSLRPFSNFTTFELPMDVLTVVPDVQHYRSGPLEQFEQLSHWSRLRSLDHTTSSES